MRTLLNFICVFAFMVSANAQYFRWKSPVNPVDTNGYVRILLQPEVSGQLHAGYPDIRLYEGTDSEIPYLLGKDRIVKGTTRFVEYPIIDKHDETGDSWITVENPLYKTENLNHLCLEVNNTEAKRWMTLTGSYDNVKWFAIKDEFLETYYESFENGAAATTNIVRFDFPLSNYRYYRFNFDTWYGWWHDYGAPVFVVRSGILVNVNPASVEDQRLELPDFVCTQNDAGKTSYIDIVFTDSQYVDYMRFDFVSKTPPGTFHRGARLYVADSLHDCGKVESSAYLSSTILSKDALNEFSPGGKKVKHLCLHVENEDDQPLTLKDMHAIQVKHYLIAFLEKGKSYHIVYGGDSIPFPKYDIRYSADDIVLHEMNVVGTGTREALPMNPPSQTETGLNSVFQNKTVIWCAMIIVVLVLAWMSVKMLREMKSGQ